MKGQTYNWAFAAAAKRAGLVNKGQVNVTLHTMRHTFASRLVSEGLDLLTVRDLLGHADIKTTQVYAHLAPEKVAGAATRLDKYADALRA